MKKLLSLSLLSLIIVLALSIHSTSAVSADQPFDVEKAIASGDHKGLADYYKTQAEAQRKIAEMHDKMKTEYRESHVHYKGTENVMAGHCGNLKFKALKMAEQYDDMAKQEEKLASQK
jgi:hypothetical protein